MKSKDLLVQLSNLETELNDFSFEKLTSAEASRLKETFLSFKSSLEEKVTGQTVSTSFTDHADFHKKLTTGHGDLDQKDSQIFSAENEGMLITKLGPIMTGPLSDILGLVDLLKEGGPTENPTKHLNAIESKSHVLLDVINELLEYAKLSAGLEQFESIDFNFYSIIRDAMYLCNTLILGKEVKIEVDMDTSIPEILVGDPSKLSQVLLNLLGSIIKCIEKGDIHLRITHKKQKGDNLLLEFDITDTGIGIPKDELNHIPDSLLRQDKKNMIHKNGDPDLGFAIVKQIIKNLNGNIMASNNLGTGTSFNFNLPFKKGEDTTPVQKEEKTKPSLEGKELVKGMRILVFEDNILNQKLIEKRLESWECITHITDNALYGLNILENNKIDIVLMDLRMPGMDGYEVTQRIRKSQNIYVKQVPVIALTADFNIGDKEECNAHGINDYILKPYTPEELMQKLIKNKNDVETILTVESTTPDAIPEKANDAPKINIDNVLEECMGELDLLEELILLYKQNALEFIGKAKTHLKNQDFEGMEFAAHKMKSGLAMMQTYSLHSIIVQIHSTSRERKDIKYLEFLYNSFLEEYPIVEKAIEDEMNKLRNK